MVLIDMGKPDEVRVRTLPHVVKFNFDDAAPKNVTARISRKGETGCPAKATIIADGDKSIQVQLGTDLAKLGHGKYTVELIQNCEVCAEECIFLDYSCSRYTTEQITPRKFKETCHCG